MSGRLRLLAAVGPARLPEGEEQLCALAGLGNAHPVVWRMERSQAGLALSNWPQWRTAMAAALAQEVADAPWSERLVEQLTRIQAAEVQALLDLSSLLRQVRTDVVAVFPDAADLRKFLDVPELVGAAGRALIARPPLPSADVGATAEMVATQSGPAPVDLASLPSAVQLQDLLTHLAQFAELLTEQSCEARLVGPDGRIQRFAFVLQLHGVRARLAATSAVDPDPRTLVWEPTLLSPVPPRLQAATDSGFVLRLGLSNGVPRGNLGGIEIARTEELLMIAVAETTVLIHLDSVLRRCRIISAKALPDALDIRWEPDKRLWPINDPGKPSSTAGGEL